MNEILFLNDCNSMSKKKNKLPIYAFKQEPKIIKSSALEKSIEILQKMECQLSQKDLSYCQKPCNFCKAFFASIEGKEYTCKKCNLVFCIKHRIPSNHHCIKISPAMDKYLSAKTKISSRLKLMKNKQGI